MEAENSHDLLSARWRPQESWWYSSKAWELRANSMGSNPPLKVWDEDHPGQEKTDVLELNSQAESKYPLSPPFCSMQDVDGRGYVYPH